MRSRPRATTIVEPLESRQLMSAAVGPSPITYSAGVTASEIPAQTFNVKNYGAKGDGVTDDRNAIQAAVTAMKANGGGTLSFPFGEYRLSRPISITNTSRFIVNGNGATLKPLDNVSPNSADGDIIQIGNCSQYTVSNLSLDGNERRRGGGFPAVSMRIDGATDFRITDCVFHDSTLDDLYLAQTVGTTLGSHDGVVENCTMDGARRGAISVIFAYDIEITNNYISNVTGFHPASGIILEANMTDPEGAIHDVLINQNTFDNCGVNGVTIVQRRSPKRITVDSNIFNNCPTGVLVRGENCVISNNTFQGGERRLSGEGSDAIGQIAVTSYVGSSVKIEGNYITDIIGMSGIHIHSTWQGTSWVENNTIKNLSGKYVGIYVASANSHVTGNRLENLPYIGIGVLGNNADIGSNLLKNGAHAAIYYTGSSGTIWRNTIIDFGMAGAGNCILTTGGVEGCRIEYNVIRNWVNSGWKGINADTNDVLIGNTISLLR